jgi:hypothetical protein
MRYREIDPLTRAAGVLWAAFSLIATGIAVWSIWNGFSDTHGSDEPDLSSELRHDSAKQIWIGLVFVVMGMLSSAFGLTLAFEREPKRRWMSPRKAGVTPNAKTALFFLTFFTGGLVLLSGMLVPDLFRGSPVAIVLALCFLAAGSGGLWVILKKRRKQRERSLKSARTVAEARERRLAGKRKRS